MLRTSRNIHSFEGFLVALILAVGLVGCGNGEAPTGKTTKTPAASGTGVAAILAKADAKDGMTDKVVTKCVTCMLGMDGEADYSVKIDEYEVHLCSPDCKKFFEQNPEKALKNLNLP